MTRDEIRGLIGGYATGTLTEAERKILFEAALQDQDLFDELAREQALKEALEEPGAEQRVIAALERPKNRWPHAWVWAATAAAVVALVAGKVLLRPRGVGVEKVDQVARLDNPAPVVRPEMEQAPEAAAKSSDAAPKAEGVPRPEPRLSAPAASLSERDSSARDSSVRDSSVPDRGPARSRLDVPVAPAPKTAPAPPVTEPSAQAGAQVQKSEAQTPKQAAAPAADAVQVDGTVAAGVPAPTVAPLGFAPQGLSQLPGQNGQAGAAAGTLAAPVPARGGAAAAPGAGRGGGGGGGGGRGGRGGGRGGPVGGAANAVRAAPQALAAPQTPPAAQAAPQVAEVAKASRFAFDYQVTPAGVLRITPSAGGFLTVTVAKGAISSPLILARPLQANAVTEVQLPADTDTVTVAFSAQERAAGPANAIAGPLDALSGTKSDPNPTANSVVFAVIPLKR